MRRVVTETSFTINRKSITNIQYADDTVILAENEQDAQQLLDSLNMESERCGLTINQIKIKVNLNDVQLEQVENFDYLGSLLTTDCRCENKIKRELYLQRRPS